MAFATSTQGRSFGLTKAHTKYIVTPSQPAPRFAVLCTSKRLSASQADPAGSILPTTPNSIITRSHSLASAPVNTSTLGPDGESANWLGDAAQSLSHNAKRRMGRAIESPQPGSTDDSGKLQSGAETLQSLPETNSSTDVLAEQIQETDAPAGSDSQKSAVANALHLLQNAARSQDLKMTENTVQTALIHAIQGVDTLGMRGLCQLSWSIGRLKSFREFDSLSAKFEGVLMAIANRVMSYHFDGKDPTLKRQLTPANLYMLLFGFAQHGVLPGADFLDQVASYSLEKKDKFKPQQFVGMVAAYATLQHDPLEGCLLNALFTHVLQDSSIVSALTGEQIIELVEATLKIKHPMPEALSDAVSTAALPHVRGLSGVQCVSLLIAFARSGHNPGNGMLFSKLFKQLSQRKVLKPLPPSQIATACWAAVLVRQQVPAKFLDAVEADAMPKLGKFTPMSYTSVAYCMALNKYSPPEGGFVDATIKKLSFSKMLTRFSPQQLSTLAWSVASLRKPPVDFMNLLAGHAIEKLPIFMPKSYSMLAVAYSTLGYDPIDGMLVDAIMDQAARRGALPQMEMLDLVQLVQAIHGLQHKMSNAFLDAVGQAVLDNSTALTASHIAALCAVFSGVKYNPLQGAVMDRFVDFLLEDDRIKSVDSADLDCLWGAAGQLQHVLPTPFCQALEHIRGPAASEVTVGMTPPANIVLPVGDVPRAEPAIVNVEE